MFFLPMFFMVYSGMMDGQTPADMPVDVDFNHVTLTDALIELSQLSGINIVFSSSTFEQHRVTLHRRATVSDILSQLLTGTGLDIRLKDGQYIIYAQRKRSKTYVISGYVEDTASGERLIAAHIYDELSGVGTSTNPYGFFSITLGDVKGRLRISYLGYSPGLVDVSADQSDGVVIQLKRSLTLDEVVIFARNPNDMNTSGLSNPSVFGERLTSGTHLGGEFDIHRYATSLPGVTTGTDGIGGMNIRGGNNDQNLVLMDGVPVYNPTHAIGILSIFNPLLIQEVRLHKGSFPARYAGRLSSVMDVRTREGNLRKWSFTGTVGPLSLNTVLEGPVIRDKASFLISARRFVPGFFLKKLSTKDKEREGLSGFTRYGFSDLNVKFNIIPSLKDRIYLSYYEGKDDYKDLTERFTPMDDSNLFERFQKRLKWGNQVGILRWNHQFGPKIFANATVTWSKFALQTLDLFNFSETILMPRIKITGFINREFKSEIEDVTARWDFDVATGAQHRIRFGLSVMHHTFRPKGIAFNDQAQVADFIVDEATLDDALFVSLQVKAWEYGMYMENEMSIGERGQANLGVHLSAFRVKGRIYVVPQPRFHLTMPISGTVGWESNASFMVQHLHLLTSSGIGLPTDLWVPSTSDVKPQRAYQISTGLNWQINDRLNIAGEVYYKYFVNITEYKEGASFLLDEGAVEASIVDAADWESKVTQGKGRSYGLELIAQYRSGRAEGTVSYVVSNSTRTFSDLNYGQPFPFRYDRRHSISSSWTYRLSGVLKVFSSWTFGSGIPITLAESKFLFPASSPFFQPVVVLEFSERNGFRLPPYHRLDFGLSATWRRPRAEHSVHLDFYNAYNRKNTLSVTLIQNSETQLFESKQFTVLPFIPSLSYRIKI